MNNIEHTQLRFDTENSWELYRIYYSKNEALMMLCKGNAHTMKLITAAEYPVQYANIMDKISHENSIIHKDNTKSVVPCRADILEFIDRHDRLLVWALRFNAAPNQSPKIGEIKESGYARPNRFFDRNTLPEFMRYR